MWWTPLCQGGKPRPFLSGLEATLLAPPLFLGAEPRRQVAFLHSAEGGGRGMSGGAFRGQAEPGPGTSRSQGGPRHS